GIEASRVYAGSPEELAPFLAEGRGGLVDVWASDLWSENAAKAAKLVPMSGTGGHTVVLTGIGYDENGKPLNAIVNDTGQGTCGEKVPIARLQGALMANNGQIVTKKPLW